MKNKIPKGKYRCSGCDKMRSEKNGTFIRWNKKCEDECLVCKRCAGFMDMLKIKYVEKFIDYKLITEGK